MVNTVMEGDCLKCDILKGIRQLRLSQHRQESPAFVLVWLPLRVTPVTTGVHLSDLAVMVRIDAPVFPCAGGGSTTSLHFSKLHPGSPALQPASLLDSLKDPLLENLMPQVTLYTSLKLRRRTTELPLVGL